MQLTSSLSNRAVPAAGQNVTGMRSRLRADKRRPRKTPLRDSRSLRTDESNSRLKGSSVHFQPQPEEGDDVRTRSGPLRGVRPPTAGAPSASNQETARSSLQAVVGRPCSSSLVGSNTQVLGHGPGPLAHGLTQNKGVYHKPRPGEDRQSLSRAPLAPRPFFLPARKHSRPQAHSYGPGRAAGRLCSNGLCDISQKLTGSEGETDKPTILKGDFHTLHSVTERTSRQVCKDIEDLNTTVTNQTRFIRINHVLNYETQAL